MPASSVPRVVAWHIPDLVLLPNQCTKMKSDLLVGLVDVWAPSNDCCSCYRAHTPPVHFEGLRMLSGGWVPCQLRPGVFSASCADPESACQDSERILLFPPASGDPVVCYSLFLYEFSSTVGFHEPWHQSKGVITQQQRVQIWPSLPPPGVQVVAAQKCNPRSSSTPCFG